MPYSCLLLTAPEPQFRLPSPDVILALSDCHQHLVTKQVALGALGYLYWQPFPGHRRIAEELCSFLLVWIVGQVEGTASTTGNVWTIGFVKNGRKGEWTRGEGDWITPSAVRLAGRHSCNS